MNIDIKEKAIKGLELYNEGKYDESEPLLLEAANSGEINGIYGMGLIYLYRRNEKDGIRFLNRAISMGPDMVSTLAKLSCGEYYCVKGDFESQYLAVCYYESVLDEDEYPEMKQNAFEMLRQIRMKMKSMHKEDNSYFEALAIEAIDHLNNGIRSEALKMLKMCVIMGAEASWIGMGIYLFEEDDNSSLEFLQRYIKRTREKTFLEEAYTLAAEIYEEKGEILEKKDPASAQLLYGKAMRNIQSAMLCAEDNDSLNELKETHSRLMKKHAFITADEMAQKKKQQNDIASVDEIENAVLSQMTCIDSYGNETPFQNKECTIPFKSANDQNGMKFGEHATKRDDEATYFKTISEYVNTFKNRFSTNDSLCFPHGDKFKNGKKYQEKMLKKMKNAISRFASDIKIDDILAYYDLSLFGSGKEGVIFTENYFYYRYVGITYKLKYDEINSIKLKPGSRNWLTMRVKRQGNSGDHNIYSSVSLYEANAVQEMLSGCIRITQNKRIDS